MTAAVSSPSTRRPAHASAPLRHAIWVVPTPTVQACRSRFPTSSSAKATGRTHDCGPSSAEWAALCAAAVLAETGRQQHQNHRDSRGLRPVTDKGRLLTARFRDDNGCIRNISCQKE
jgi:hypothetical protein